MRKPLTGVRLLRVKERLQSLAGCQRGSIMLAFALFFIILAVAAGMAIDLWQGWAVKRRLQAALDAAALAIAANNPSLKTQAQMQQIALNYLSANYPAGAIGTPGPPVVTYANNVVTVNATASVPTTLMRLVKIDTLSVSATTQVTMNQPNIDFYLLLDDSPSMAIPATVAGINSIENLTASYPNPPQSNEPYQSCAFACHEANPTTGVYVGGQEQDLYGLARANNIALRMDELTSATQSLMTTAQSTENANEANYRMAIYTFDANVNTIQPITANLTQAQSSAANMGVLQVYDENQLTATTNNADEDTDANNALTVMNSTMPLPGNGTNNAGDTPQEVLFFVTDGVADYNLNGNRTISAVNPSWCSAVKARGIRIAVLYTVYYPLPGSTMYENTVAPIPQSNIGPELQSCASPGLYFSVDTGGDITAAMAALFNVTVETAYISK